MTPPISRRNFIKLISAGSAAVYLSRSPFLSYAKDQSQDTDALLSSISPIDRTMPDKAPKIWFGDDPSKAHSILWNKNGFISSLPGGKLPERSEQVPLVIIGGGISGLSTAYLLRDHSPIILEQAPRFGGNSKGQSWNNIDYSIGAAYFIVPDSGSQVDKFVRELELHKHWRIKGEEEASALIGDKLYDSFWSGQSDPKYKIEFQKISNYLKALNNEENGLIFPTIPIEDPSQRQYIDRLDKISLIEHLRKFCNKDKLHDHIETCIEYYCWSSFGASASEIGAASGLNFIAAEFGEVAVLPGGNSFAAEAILQKLYKTVPRDNLRTQSLVFDIQVTSDGALVSYVDKDGVVKVINAKTVVMSCPKFIATKIINELEPERIAAIQKLKYRSYLVANVLLNGTVKEPFYDLYLLGSGTYNSLDIRLSSSNQQATDVVLANFASINSKHSVLTLYRAFPYDGARAEIFSPDSLEKHTKSFEDQIHRTILPKLGFSAKSVSDLRLARWGHPLPVASKDLIADKIVDQIQKPFRDCVFFIEQDNWALPAFETAVTEAINWSDRIKSKLS